MSSINAEAISRDMPKKCLVQRVNHRPQVNKYPGHWVYSISA